MIDEMTPLEMQDLPIVSKKLSPLKTNILSSTTGVTPAITKLPSSNGVDYILEMIQANANANN
jgi:hypothetical protein